MRILLIFLALLVIFAVGRQIWQRARMGKRPQQQLSGKMVRCNQCGMYLPEEEALRSGEHWYCSREHRDADSHDD